MQFKPYKFKKFVVLEINVFTRPVMEIYRWLKGSPAFIRDLDFVKDVKRDRFQVKFIMREIDTKNRRF